MPIVIYDGRNSLLIPIQSPGKINEKDAANPKKPIVYLAPGKKGFPKNIVRLVPGANELTVSQWKSIQELEHPKIERYLETGKISLLGSKGMINQPKGIPANELPEHLRDVKNLQALEPKEAVFLVENTMDVEVLGGWLSAEAKTVNRASVLEALTKQIKRVKEVQESGTPKDSKSAKAAAAADKNK